MMEYSHPIKLENSLIFWDDNLKRIISIMKYIHRLMNSKDFQNQDTFGKFHFYRIHLMKIMTLRRSQVIVTKS